MPDLTPAHQALHRLIGTWAGQEKLFASPQSAESTAQGHVTFRPILGGLAVSQAYSQTRADGSVFELYGVLTIDPETQQPVWYSFDGFIPAPEHPARGEWYGSTLGLEKVTARGVARHRITVAGDHLNHVIATAQHPPNQAGPADEDFQVFMDGTYQRVKD